ncbi:hypothetical protein VP01_6608g2 [Puccinia sorghi]|uniref:Uncharacterized protein n=1 Tax=Puccinia sorghi TaxID=27349 RepID=A0A0L6UF59_9BASI|nr:hypothetical protein VP01_6608g2 [Puccinia sorghi]
MSHIRQTCSCGRQETKNYRIIDKNHPIDEAVSGSDLTALPSSSPVPARSQIPQAAQSIKKPQPTGKKPAQAPQPTKNPARPKKPSPRLPQPTPSKPPAVSKPKPGGPQPSKSASTTTRQPSAQPSRSGTSRSIAVQSNRKTSNHHIKQDLEESDPDSDPDYSQSASETTSHQSDEDYLQPAPPPFRPKSSLKRTTHHVHFDKEEEDASWDAEDLPPRPKRCNHQDSLRQSVKRDQHLHTCKIQNSIWPSDSGSSLRSKRSSKNPTIIESDSDGQDNNCNSYGRHGHDITYGTSAAVDNYAYSHFNILPRPRSKIGSDEILDMVEKGIPHRGHNHNPL